MPIQDFPERPSETIALGLSTEWGLKKKEMLNEHRLKRHKEFREVLGQGKSWGERSVALRVLARPDSGVRIGLVVSKRLGNAVARNRVKRRLREAIRKHINNIVPGHDLVFVARAPLATSSFRDLETSVERLLRRAGVLAPAGVETKAGSPSDIEQIAGLQLK